MNAVDGRERREKERTINRSGKQILRWKLKPKPLRSWGELEGRCILLHTQVCREKHIKWRSIFWNSTVYAIHHFPPFGGWAVVSVLHWRASHLFVNWSAAFLLPLPEHLGVISICICINERSSNGSESPANDDQVGTVECMWAVYVVHVFF